MGKKEPFKIDSVYSEELSETIFFNYQGIAEKEIKKQEAIKKRIDEIERISEYKEKREKKKEKERQSTINTDSYQNDGKLQTNIPMKESSQKKGYSSITWMKIFFWILLTVIGLLLSVYLEKYFILIAAWVCAGLITIYIND